MMDSMSHLILLSNQMGVGTLEIQKHGAVHLSATRTDIIVDIHKVNDDICITIYDIDSVLDMNFSLQFRDEAVDFLLPLFPPLESKSSHAFAITRILVTLSNPCGTSVQISCAGRNAIGVPTHIRSCRGRRRRVKPTRDDRRTRFGRRLNIRAGPCRCWSSTRGIGRDVKSCLRDELNSASNKVN